MLPDAIKDARVWLAGRLAFLAVRALMAQFAGARPPDVALRLALGTEPATEGRERYATFVRTMAADGLEALADTFPVLPRLLATTIQAWSHVMDELQGRLRTDAESIASTFGAKCPLQVLRTELGAGDMHCGGRMVTVLTLAGPDKPVRIVYKPKPMQLEQAYHRLAATYVGTTERSVPLRILAIGDTHGYATFVKHRPAANAAELSSFYRHAGRLLALLYLLGATDCHAENIIACGEMPVLIDPETLFDTPIRPAGGHRDIVGEATHSLGTSVLRTGILPAWQVDPSRQQATDVSALGFDPGTEEKHADTWININTDAMTRASRPVPLSPCHCLPVAAGEANPLARYADDLVDGFLTASRELQTPPCRTTLAGQLARLAGLRRRTVLRATRIYAKMEMHLLSPACLRSASARGIALERLARGFLLDAQSQPLWTCYLAELHDMENLDIPYFDHSLGSSDLHGGGYVIRDALTSDGLAEAIERVQRTSENDLAWQSQLIRAAIGMRTYQMRNPAPITISDSPAIADSATWHPGEQAILFTQMLDQLEQSAIRDSRGNLTWLSFGLLGDGRQAGLGLMDYSLYAGHAGLLAFLCQLAAAGMDHGIRTRAATLAEQTWHTLCESLLGCTSSAFFRLFRDTGLGLTGAGGILRLLALPNVPASPKDRLQLQTRLLAAIDSRLIPDDRRLDVIGGTAGAIGPITDLCQQGNTPVARRLLQDLAEHLLENQDRHTGGWITPLAPRALTGYSHGAAGMGLALLRAGKTLDDDRFTSAGVRAFGYEQSLFDAREVNWPDLRAPSTSCMNAWCHGAAGIGLSRGIALQLHPEHPAAGTWQAELDGAAKTIASTMPQPSDHLCCGNAGRAFILRALGIWIGDRRYRDADRSLTGTLRAHWRGTGSFRLNTLGKENTAGIAGLMTGLPGIGLHLLCGETDLTLAHLLS